MPGVKPVNKYGKPDYRANVNFIEPEDYEGAVISGGRGSGEKVFKPIALLGAVIFGLVFGGTILFVGYSLMMQAESLTGVMLACYASLLLSLPVAAYIAVNAGMVMSRGRMPIAFRLVLFCNGCFLLAMWHLYLDPVPLDVFYAMQQYKAMIVPVLVLLGGMLVYWITVRIALRFGSRKAGWQV